MDTLPVEDNEIGRLKWVSGIGNSSGRLFISSMEIYIFSYTEYKLIQNHYSVKYLKFCREYTGIKKLNSVHGHACKQELNEHETEHLFGYIQ